MTAGINMYAGSSARWKRVARSSTIPAASAQLGSTVRVIVTDRKRMPRCD